MAFQCLIVNWRSLGWFHVRGRDLDTGNICSWALQMLYNWAHVLIFSFRAFIRSHNFRYMDQHQFVCRISSNQSWSTSNDWNWAMFLQILKEPLGYLENGRCHVTPQVSLKYKLDYFFWKLTPQGFISRCEIVSTFEMLLILDNIALRFEMFLRFWYCRKSISRIQLLLIL